MIERRVVGRLNPLKTERLIILADPQRMIRAGAQAVDVSGKDNKFNVLFCSGNLAPRETQMPERQDPHCSRGTGGQTKSNGHRSVPA